jgi:hypothetical protein
MLPSGETSTAVTAAHGAPFGGCPQSRTVRYGFGKSFNGSMPLCAYAHPSVTAIEIALILTM